MTRVIKVILLTRVRHTIDVAKVCFIVLVNKPYPLLRLATQDRCIGRQQHAWVGFPAKYPILLQIEKTENHTYISHRVFISLAEKGTDRSQQL